MHVAEIWRYPVKSMAGERLERTEIEADGIRGDRVVHVSGPRGRVVTSRTHPRLLGLHGTLGDDGEPRVDGRPWTAPETAAAVRAAAGSEARLVRYDGPERFDVLPLLVGTDGAFAELGVDHRRLRPNIVVGGVEGLAERDWPGRTIRIGAALVQLVQLRPRCVMTTFDPDTIEQDHGVLRRIVRAYDGTFALDAYVVEPGRVHVGDPVIVAD